LERSIPAFAVSKLQRLGDDKAIGMDFLFRNTIAIASTFQSGYFTFALKSSSQTVVNIAFIDESLCHIKPLQLPALALMAG
jgi:hypothetical protein